MTRTDSFGLNSVSTNPNVGQPLAATRGGSPRGGPTRYLAGRFTTRAVISSSPPSPTRRPSWTRPTARTPTCRRSSTSAHWWATNTFAATSTNGPERAPMSVRQIGAHQRLCRFCHRALCAEYESAMLFSFTAHYHPRGCESRDATGERSDITGRSMVESGSRRSRHERLRPRHASACQVDLAPLPVVVLHLQSARAAEGEGVL